MPVLSPLQEVSENGKGTETFSSAEELAALATQWPGMRLVEIWNSLPGGHPVERFTSRQARLVTKIPSGLSAKEMERFLRENGAQLCGSRPAQSPRGPGDGGVSPIGATGLNPVGTPAKAPEITVELS